MAEVALLVLVPDLVMKGVDAGLPFHFKHVGTKKVCGDAEGTARSSLAVRAMANVVLLRLPRDGDRAGSTGTLGDSRHWWSSLDA